ncbi:MAG TPA: class I poly(R)-hydroxyalkanoic acid synthase [Thiolinea sp.]|nr:class I poly(R)-hydroxyalkanoic acid synthase [Thiolinea sp.]
MGTPAQTQADGHFSPVALQSNLLKASLLWKQFCSRMVADYLEGDTPNVSNEAFTRAVSQWVASLVANPVPVFQAGVNYLADQTQLWQGMSARLAGLNDFPLSRHSSRDRRFKDESWQTNPLGAIMMQSYLNFADYWKSLTRVQDGMAEADAEKARFLINIMVDALAPNNYAMTNPEVWNAVLASNGENLVRGMENLLQDFQQGELRIRMTDTEAFEVGRDIATTPGQVVFRNELLELIQYNPSTPNVHQTPLLIIPPWINKYYILDLREKNSFVKWAVEQGHTVFMISWKNPGSDQKDLSFDDYLRSGTLTAMDVVEKITGERELNLAAYCLGGTLAAATLAYLNTQGDHRVKSATFFTTLIDFSEPGEIGVFLDEQQVSALEKLMEANGGYLDGKNMGAAFNMLRANDLIWSFFVNLYLLGKDPMPFDLLYWNSDSTRMPAAMHSFYLRNMYLQNRLQEPGGITLLNTPIDISAVKTPVYFVSAHDDHIAPWKTTYLGAQLFAGPRRFVLGESGHIAGIVNPPAANKYGHWVNNDLSGEADDWFAGAEKVAGSWWLDWDQWVSQYEGESVAAREPGAGALKALYPAPGHYVLEKS